MYNDLTVETWDTSVGHVAHALARPNGDVVAYVPKLRDAEQLAKLADEHAAMVALLQDHAQRQHHFVLDGKGSHAPDCPPCQAAALLARIEGRQA